MDFNTLDSRTASETARAYHVRHQATGDPIWDGDKPCLVMVRGATSRSVQAAIKAKAQADMKAKDAKDEARALEDLQVDMIAAAARLIIGFENVNNGDRPATLDDAKWFLDLNFVSLTHQLRKDDAWHKPSFAQQIVDFASDESRFLDSALPA